MKETDAPSSFTDPIAAALRTLQIEQNELIERHMADSGNQSLRRELLRSFCSYVETHMFGIQDMMITVLDHKEEFGGRGIFPKYFDLEVSLVERTILHEVRGEIKDDGSVREIAVFSKPVNKLKFLINLSYRVLRLNPPKIAKQDWDSLVETIKKRNSIVHPRNVATLEITTVDLRNIFRSRDWVFETINSVYPLYQERMERCLQDIHKAAVE